MSNTMESYCLDVYINGNLDGRNYEEVTVAWYSNATMERQFT